MSTNTAIKRKLRWYQWLLVGVQQGGPRRRAPSGEIHALRGGWVQEADSGRR